MNVDNRTLFIADNLDIMRGMDSDMIDLIYLDPPFNSKKQYKAPIGSPAEGASFKDIWTDEDVRDGWHSEIAEDYPQIHQIILASEHTYDHSMMIYLKQKIMHLNNSDCNGNKKKKKKARKMRNKPEKMQKRENEMSVFSNFLGNARISTKSLLQ